jgi:hypothetical protein
MSFDAPGAFYIELPIWFAGCRAGGLAGVATGRLGESECLLLFTDGGLARRCVRDNHISNARVGKLVTPREVLDFLDRNRPEGVTHIAFDVGRVGDAAPAVVPWEELAAKLRELPEHTVPGW